LATDGVNTYSYTLFKDVDIINPPYGRNVAIGYSGVTGSQSSIFSFTDAGFEMSALQGNTFDREYTAEVSAGGLMPLSTIFLLFHEFQFYGEN
jgi:hypothetical protein